MNDTILRTKYERMTRLLKYDVSIEDLMQFKDIEKLRMLYKKLHVQRGHGPIGRMYFDNEEELLKALNKLYYDQNFNRVYERWIETGDKYDCVSIDHIIPVSTCLETGLFDNPQCAENICVMSHFENNAKGEMTMQEYADTVTYYYGDEAGRIVRQRYNILTIPRDEISGVFLLSRTRSNISRDFPVFAKWMATRGY